jgi:hypothetical protein
MGDKKIAPGRIDVEPAQALIHGLHAKIEVHPGVDDQVALQPLYHVSVDRPEKRCRQGYGNPVKAGRDFFDHQFTVSPFNSGGSENTTCPALQARDSAVDGFS